MVICSVIALIAVVGFKFDPYTALYRFIKSSLLSSVGYDITCEKSTKEALLSAFTLDNVVVKHKDSGHVVFRANRVQFNQSFISIILSLTKLPVPLNVYVKDAVVDFDSSLFSQTDKESLPQHKDETSSDSIFNVNNLYKHGLSVKLDSANVFISSGENKFYGSDMSLDISFDTALNFKRFEMSLPELKYKNNSGEIVNISSVAAIKENDRINLFLGDVNVTDTGDRNLSFSLGKLNPYIQKNSSGKQTLFIPVPDLNFTYKGMKFFSKQADVAAEFTSWDEIELSVLSDKISFQNISPSITLDTTGFSAKFNSSDKGKAQIKAEFEGKLSALPKPFKASVEGNFDNLATDLKGDIRVSKIDIGGIDEKFNATMSVSGGNIDCTLESESYKTTDFAKQVNGKIAFNYQTQEFNFKLDIDSFNAQKINGFIPGITNIFLSPSSVLSGSVELAGKSTNTIDSRGYVALRCSDLKVLNNHGDMTVKGRLETKDNKLFINDTNIKLFTYTLSLSGVYPLTVGLPEFSVALLSEQNEIANGTFRLENGVYKGNIASKSNNLSFDGSFYSEDSTLLTHANGVLGIYGADYVFSLLYNRSNKELKFTSDNLAINGLLKSGDIVKVKASGFKIPPVPKLGIVHSSLNADISIKLFDSSIKIESSDFSLIFTDSSHLKFVLYADEKIIRLSNIDFLVQQKRYDGGMFIQLIGGNKWSFDNIKAALSLKSADGGGAQLSYYPVNGRPTLLAELNKFEGLSFIKHNPFSTVDLKLMAENRNSGEYVAYGYFFAENDAKNTEEKKSLKFDISFENNQLFLSDLDMNINSLNVKKGFLNVDTQTGKGQFKADVLYMHPQADGFKEFGCSLIGAADIKNLIDNSFNFENLTSPLSANIAFSAVKLASSYYPPDFGIDLKYDNAVLTASGNMISGKYSVKDSTFELNVDKAMSVSFNAKGTIQSDTMDIYLSNVFLPIKFLDNLIWGNAVKFDNGLFHGDLRITGDIGNPQFYGSLAAPSAVIWNLWAEDEECTLVNPKLIAYGNTINIPQVDVYAYNRVSGRKSKFKAECKLTVKEWDLPLISLVLDIDKNNPVSVSVPLPVPNMNVDAKEAWGRFEMDLYYLSYPTIRFNITANDVTLASPSRHYLWMYNPDSVPSPLAVERGNKYTALDGDITIGKGGRFMFPSKTAPLINAAVAENQTGKIEYKDGKFTVNSDIDIKSGEIFYFNKNFQITGGTLSWHPNSMMDEVLRSPYATDNNKKYSDLAGMNLSITSRLKDFDLNGNPTDIYLTLDNATMENLSPRFSSSTGLSDAEILSILGQNILPTNTYSSSGLSSLAYISSVALDVFSQVGGINASSKSTFNDTTKRALGLDMFSVRQRIFYNIMADVIPDTSFRSTSSSAFSRYLNGTTIFMGKHITNNLFFHATVHFLSSEKEVKSRKLGNIFIQGLTGDMEFALEWNTEIATLSLFTNPGELSFLGIMNNIGISVKRHFVL